MEFPNIGRHRWIKGTLKTCITEPISSDVTDATNCHCPAWYWQLSSLIQSSSSQISCPSFPLPKDPREIPVHKVSAEKSKQRLQTSIFPRWKNFASCPDWAIETAFEQVVWVYERHDWIDCWWKLEGSGIVFASVMTKGTRKAQAAKSLPCLPVVMQNRYILRGSLWMPLNALKSTQALKTSSCSVVDFILS